MCGGFFYVIGDGACQVSSNSSSRSSAVGISAAGNTSDASGGQPAHLVAGAEQRQFDLVTELGHDR